MKLADADILRLLPEHISGDSQFAATGAAANPVLGAAWPCGEQRFSAPLAPADPSQAGPAGFGH